MDSYTTVFFFVIFALLDFSVGFILLGVFCFVELVDLVTLLSLLIFSWLLMGV